MKKKAFSFADLQLIFIGRRILLANADFS